MYLSCSDRTSCTFLFQRPLQRTTRWSCATEKCGTIRSSKPLVKGRRTLGVPASSWRDPEYFVGYRSYTPFFSFCHFLASSFLLYVHNGSSRCFVTQICAPPWGGCKSRRMSRPRRYVRPKLAIHSKRRMRVRSTKAYGGTSTIFDTQLQREVHKLPNDPPTLSPSEKTIQETNRLFESCRLGGNSVEACAYLISLDEQYEQLKADADADADHAITSARFESLTGKYPTRIIFLILQYAKKVMKVAIKQKNGLKPIAI